MPRRSGGKSNYHESLDGDLKNMDPAAVEKISSILGNIIQLKTNCGIGILEETDLFAVLNNQPVEHHQYILYFARGFYDACCELYEPNSTLAEHEGNEKPQSGIWDIDTSLNDEDVDTKTTKSKKGEKRVHKNSNKAQSVKSMFDNHNSSTGTGKSDIVSRAQSATTSDLTSIDSMTTISFEDVKISDGDSDVGEDGLNNIREQTIKEFINDARDQLLRIGAAEPSPQRPENLTTLLNSLDDNSTHLPSGSEWVSLIKKGYGDRQRGTIYYTLAAVRFEKWHRLEVEKVRRLNPGKGLTEAKIKVSAIVLGPKPVSTTKKGEWDRRRKHLSTHLTRGRKWRRLIDVFGRGILLKNPWRLAKTKTPDLDHFIEDLKRDSRKCLVLTLLAKQVNLLFEEGGTNESEFCMQLRENEFQLLDGSVQECLEIELQEFRNKFGQSDQLRVKGPQLIFKAESLKMLHLQEWLNDDLILACMHLSRKLSCVVVGWSLKTHSSERGEAGEYPVLSNPFSGAVSAIKKWQYGARPKENIYFFPLFQKNNHFSLLEINMKEDSIYHYDSHISTSRGKENLIVKEACIKAFPALKYIEKRGIELYDGHSCGPVVIKVASRRMWGEAATSKVESENVAESLRLHAVRLLHNAWESGALVKVYAANKRGLSITEAQERRMAGRKRQKVTNVAPELL